VHTFVIILTHLCVIASFQSVYLVCSATQLQEWLFHSLTRTAYLYSKCLAWYNVVLTSRLHSSVKYRRQWTVTAAVSCDGVISVLNHCLSWAKFVNTHLYHSRQWFNIHLLLSWSYTGTVPNCWNSRTGFVFNALPTTLWPVTTNVRMLPRFISLSTQTRVGRSTNAQWHLHY